MRIGIYLRNVDPAEGGAFQFSDTAAEGIRRIKREYEVVVCHRGGLFSKVIVLKDGIPYLNLNAYLLRHFIKLMRKQLCLDMHDIKRKLTLRPRLYSSVSLLDEAAKTYGIDIFWFLNPDHEVISTPYIYTVWDMGHRELPMFPEVSSPASEWDKREARYHEMLPKASYILTGNEAGKREILSNYPVSGSKVRIAPFEISSFCYGKDRKPKVRLPDEYFIYPAQFWPHKNHICILKALRILAERYGYRPAVIFTGSDRGNKAYVKETAFEYGLKDQVYFLGYVSGEELKYLYLHAKALIFASLMGPNNLPPDEAVFLGCPAIISDLEGHREQMGDTVFYFESRNPESLAEKMYEFSDDPALTKDLRERMAEYSEKQSSYKYSSAVMEVLHEFLNIQEAWKSSQKELIKRAQKKRR